MSHSNQEEIILMIDITPGSSPKKKKLPILRVDLTKSPRATGSTRTSVDYLYSQVSPNSPLLSADRLSVKFAPEVFDFQDIEMEKVRFNKENAVTDGEDNEEGGDEAAVGDEEEEEEEEEEDEDYSASVSAILMRRASSRRQTKRRRPSSAFSPDELGLPRRRSSVVTTTSAETAISIEEGVTEEHIFQNIRLHKEVLSSVKQQPWPMRKKIKLVKQAKKYVKRHEGELQERLAQSKTTKDMLACCDIIFVKEWQFVKRELANLMNVMVPWELRIKEIESHFGSVVASYFTFLRWLFWVNLMISLILLTFVAIPEILFADYKDAGERKKLLPEEAAISKRLITYWEFEGFLKYSPLFYGYYNSQESSKRGYGYKGPLAYFITGIAVYIYSFVATLKRMAQNSRQSKLSEKDDECVFTWKLFTGWDYMIGNSETAHNRTASIILGFKEALLEEAEKKRDERSWKMLALRALINLCVLGLFAFSVFAVVSVVKRSASPQNEKRRGWWKQNEVTIIVSLITNVFPFLFEILGSMERYHPRKRLRMQLGRIMVLNLLNLYTFIFASFSKINDKTVQLQKIKESLMNITMAASMKMESVSPTVSALANTIIDDSRATSTRQMNCSRVMRCSTITSQSTTSDMSSTSISSLATLLLLTSTTISPPLNIMDNNSTLVVPDNVNRTFETSPQLIPDNVNRTFETSPQFMPDNVNRTFETSPQSMHDSVNRTFETSPQFMPYNVNRTSETSPQFMPDNVNKIFDTSPQFIPGFLDNTNEKSDKSNELEDNDNEIWKNQFPNLFKSSSHENSKPAVGKQFSTSVETPPKLNSTNSNPHVYNGSNPRDIFDSNWPIDTIKFVVNTQYNVTDLDENNETIPFEFDIRSEIDYEVDKSPTIYTDNETYVDYDNMMNYTSTTSTYDDLENATDESTSTSADGCYYETVCSEWSPDASFSSTTKLPVEATTENVDQKSVGTHLPHKPTDLPANIDLSLETHRLNMTMRRTLRNLCWETVFGQELVKLTVMDLLLTIISTLMVDFIRALFVRVMNNCWCWDLEKKFPQYGDFKIAENILHLVNNQGMVWMGMFFSPGLPLINLIKLAIMMYLRSWAVLTCNVPHEVVFRASRSNNFYLALLLTMLFLCVLPVSYAIVWVDPSWHCGPFSNYPKIYYLFTNSTKKALPKELHHTLDYIASPGIVIPLLMLLILVIYYLISLTNSLREANNDLKVQLRRERTEERRKVFQMVDRKHRGDFSGDLIDNTPFLKWQKTLTILPNKTSTDTPSDTAPIISIAHAQNSNGDLKSDAKKLVAKLTKHAKHKASEEQDEKIFLLDETCIDLEPPDTSPVNQSLKSKHQSSKQADVIVDVHVTQSPSNRIDQHTKHHPVNIKKKGVEKSENPDHSTEKRGGKTTDSVKKKHRRRGSTSSVSSEDIPEIVITHTTSTDSLLDRGQPFDKSKPSSVDTVIEGQKDTNISENKTKMKNKSSTSHNKLQRDQDSGKKQREHLDDKDVKVGEKKKEKSSADHNKDLEVHEETKKQDKKHSHDKKKENSVKDTGDKKLEESVTHNPQKKMYDEGIKRSSKIDKKNDDSFKEKTSVTTPKCDDKSVEKVKDKKHFDQDKEYSTESSVEKHKRKREEKHKRSLKDKEPHDSHTESSKSNRIDKVDGKEKLVEDGIHTSKKTSHHRTSSQKSDRKTHKSDREDKRKQDGSKSVSSGSKEIEGKKSEKMSHKTRRHKENLDDCGELSSGDESCKEDKNFKKKQEEKYHTVRSSGKFRTGEETDETTSISTESSKIAEGRKKKVEDASDGKKKDKEYHRVEDEECSDDRKKKGAEYGGKIKKIKEGSGRNTPEIKSSSSLQNEAKVESDEGKRSDVEMRDQGKSGENSKQQKDKTKSRDHIELVREEKSSTDDISSGDDSSASNKTIASKRDSDLDVKQSDSEGESDLSTEIPSSKISRKRQNEKDTATNNIERDNDSVSDNSSETSESNEKIYSSGNVNEKRNREDLKHDRVDDLKKERKNIQNNGILSDSGSETNDHDSSEEESK